MADKIFPTGFSDIGGTATSLAKLYADDGSTNGYITLLKAADILGIQALLSNTTVNFNSSLTAAQIQALIDTQPYNLNGYTLTFQFLNGTYTLNNSITFENFRNGTLVIQGLATETTLSATKSVTLDFSGQNLLQGIIVRDCDDVTLQAMKIIMKTDTFGGYAAYLERTVGAEVEGLYCVGNSKTAGMGVYCFYSIMFVGTTYIDNMDRGLYASHGSSLYSGNNDDTGTIPNYGLTANAAHIYKFSTQPSGTTANESTSNGGQIT